MPERDGYIPGVPCWADTAHPDPESVLPFYRGLFGWEFEDAMPEGSDGSYFIGRIRGGDVAAVGPAPDGAPPMAVWNTYIWVDRADDAAARAREAGGTVLAEPFDVMDAGRMAVISDPEGAAFCVWEPKQHKGSRVVNEHGAVVFNVLATRDVERAKAFYGAVFGWGTLDDTMWTLPGYGDHLEAASPGLRDQMAQMGVPDGFVDVVASIEPIHGSDSTTPARWSITFGVDDADGAAARAKELGGRIMTGPQDAPWTRTAVIEDPQGASFIVGQFVPENRDLPS
jgi:uncharacterized protein